MGAFTGTGTLMRLALRRDRIKLPAWVLGITTMFAFSAIAAVELYASDAAARATYALTTAPSIVSRVFAGPLGGADAGSIVLNETFLFTAAAAAFMSTLAIVRHTRQNEETGRSELIGSAVVGRQASLTAALVVVFAANALLGLFISLILAGNDLPIAGSIATGAAVSAVGILFAAAAAVTAQISENARGANSMAALVIGVAFLLRAVGDGMGNLAQNGMALVSTWPSWLSPLGWSQQVYPFTEQRWWVFSLFGALSLVLIGIAFTLTNRRDIGLGMLPARKGPATARASLLSPFGLAWRLQKGILKAWAVTIVVLGASYGLVAKEFENLFTENQAAQELMQQLGGTENITDALLGALLFFMAITIAAYAVQALQRLRSEEAGGQLEPILATAVSRPRWALSHITCTVIGISVMTLLTGLSLSIAYVLASGESWSEVGVLTGSTFVHMPAILAVAGFAVLAFGLLPRMAIGLAWGAFAFCLLIGQFGAALKLPQWVMNISPFSHTPSVPADAVTVAPLALLVTAAVVMGVLGLAFLRRRDLTAA